MVVVVADVVVDEFSDLLSVLLSATLSGDEALLSAVLSETDELLSGVLLDFASDVLELLPQAVIQANAIINADTAAKTLFFILYRLSSQLFFVKYSTKRRILQG